MDEKTISGYTVPLKKDGMVANPAVLTGGGGGGPCSNKGNWGGIRLKLFAELGTKSLSRYSLPFLFSNDQVLESTSNDVARNDLVLYI